MLPHRENNYNLVDAYVSQLQMSRLVISPCETHTIYSWETLPNFHNQKIVTTQERVWSSGTVQDSGSLDREFDPR